MKIKHLHNAFIAFIVISIFSGLFMRDVSKSQAQDTQIWDVPTNLSNSGGASNPALVVDTLGVIHVFWIDELDGYRYVESADGKEWSLPKNRNYPFDILGTPPMLVAGKNGLIYVFYQNKQKALIFAQAQSKNLGEPSAWENQTQLSSNALSFDVSVNQQGVLHVAYIKNIDDVLGPSGVYYTQSSNGASWSTEKILYTSQYFRTITLDAAHVRVITSSEAGGEKVFVAWDNTSVKRIFMSTSNDSGINWADIVQLKGPEDTGGYDVPYNVNMSVHGEDVLLTWEVGEPGSDQCDLYGQWSIDGGNSWGEPDTILNHRSICPRSLEFLTQEDRSILALIQYDRGSPSFIAWNGNEWSEPEVQDELSFFANPVTNETLILGCQTDYINGDHLFLVGCDQGGSGDIWITSRLLAPANDWIFPASLWSLPTQLTSTSQKIPFIAYISDREYLHTLWAQSPITGIRDIEGAIHYARWNNESQWSIPKNVINGVNGQVGGLSSVATKQGRLILVWSDEKTGSLLYSWANSLQADEEAEWESPRPLPSPSIWTSSPDILVDASGKIVVVYAVPFNENRGIYIVQSSDNGVTWSVPIKIYDAVSADWEMVNYPKITISGDGRLHVLFNRFSGLENHPDELYYSQSVDGGVKWIDPELVSGGSVVWSEIVSNDKQTVHRLWQEIDNKSIVVNFDQISQDGGVSWEKPNYITEVSDAVMPVALAGNDVGELHFIQLVLDDSPKYLKEYDLRIKDWRWNGNQWDYQTSQTMTIKGEKAVFSVGAGITSNGFISASILAAYYDLQGNLKNEIYTIGRSLNLLTGNVTPIAPIIPAANDALASTQPPSTQPTQLLPESTINPVFNEDAPSAINKNLAGVFLVIIVLGLVLFIFLRRSGNKDQN